MKKLLLGNQAVARGLYEAGCRFVSSYPGTPSTEITEAVSRYPEVYAEWAPNEKVACEAALGAAIGGGRAFCGMKHVGLNVAADPLFTSSYTGINGGLIIGVADDQGMHSSQNEQDSRHYAAAAKLPMVEPSDSAECLRFVKEAYAISEEYDTPVLLRTCTRVAHSQSVVELGQREEAPVKPYRKDPSKYVMMPGNAIPRHAAVEERMDALRALAETTPLNRAEPGSGAVGFITAGICYQYVREVFPDAPVLKLGLVHPLPTRLITDFASSVEQLYVVEELDGIIEAHCRALGIPVAGGKNLFSLCGELSQGRLAAALEQQPPPSLVFDEDVPVRPPVLCPGCPHRGLFYLLNKLRLTVLGDIGCYTLGALPPLSSIDTTVCMGSSISTLHGFNTVRGPDSAAASVAVIGDSTFMHSGIPSLIDITYNQGISTVVILDNSTTGMTGHQQNPTTGLTLKGVPTPQISIEAVCRAVGVERIRTVDPNNLKELEAALREELAVPSPSVIITRRPCTLLKSVVHEPPYTVNLHTCVSCKACMRVGCPAMSALKWGIAIDPTLCVGCGLCAQLCASSTIIREVSAHG